MSYFITDELASLLAPSTIVFFFGNLGQLYDLLLCNSYFDLVLFIYVRMQHGNELLGIIVRGVEPKSKVE